VIIHQYHDHFLIKVDLENLKSHGHTHMHATTKQQQQD
jgi:hypothetical protein